MQLLFKQKFSWLLDNYEIYDEYGRTAFYVRGRFAFKHKLEIYNAKNQYIGMINEEFLTITPRFAMYIGDRYIGDIRKRFTFFKPAFDLDCNGWYVEGDFLQWDYTVHDRQGSLVMTAHKEVFNWTDTYRINIVHDKDALHCLMIVLAIDAAKCTQSK